MRRIYRVEIVVSTVLGPQRAQNEGVYDDIWQALADLRPAYERHEAATADEPREVIGLVLSCVGAVSDKPIILDADGEPLEQDLEEDYGKTRHEKLGGGDSDTREAGVRAVDPGPEPHTRVEQSD